MKSFFNLKLIISFVSIILLLLFATLWAFNNFYSFYNEERDLENIQKTLNSQEERFLSYIKIYDYKLFFINEMYLSLKNKNGIENFMKKIIFKDKDIHSFKVVGFDSKELLHLKNNEMNKKDEKLRTLFLEKYFKELINLNSFEIYHYFESNYGLKLLNFAIKGEKEFFILTLNLENIFNEITNSYISKVYIKNKNGELINHFERLKYKQDRYISKKIQLQDEDYFTFMIQKGSEQKKFVKENYKIILISAFILAIILAIVFTIIIAKENDKIVLEKDELSSHKDSAYLTISENEKIINEYIMFIKINKNGTIKDISKSISTFLGFSKAELIGHNYKLFISKDLDKVFKKNLIKRKQKTFKINSIRGTKKDSEPFWFDIFVGTIFKDGNLEYYNIVCQDITDKKKTDFLYKNLNTTVEEYDAIFDGVQSGIALLSLDYSFTKVNTSMTQLLGYSEEEFLNMKVFDILFDKTRNIMKDILNDIEYIKELINLEDVFVTRDGTEIHLEFSLILMLEKQRIMFFVNSLEDKRKLQELNINLENKIQEEIQKSKAKDEVHYQEQLKSAKLSYIGTLSAGITHEINTPLTYIKGNLELMQYDIEDLPKSDIKERMLLDSKKIKEGIVRIANIIESMREISSKKSETRDKFNVYSTLITSLTITHNKAKYISKIYINDELFDINEINYNTFEFFSFIQTQRIEQVWIIVINNALDELIKIEEYDKRELRINIFEEDDFIVIKFKDNAKGIDEKIMSKLFEPFSSSKEHGGMGLGLSIAKKIVDEHEGSIEAFNDAGAVFEIKLKKYKEESL